MSMKDIEILLAAKPFVPFRIHMSDGSKVDVTHPEWVFLGKVRLEVATPLRKNNGGRVVSRTDFYALMHMVRVEMMETQEAAAM